MAQTITLKKLDAEVRGALRRGGVDPKRATVVLYKPLDREHAKNRRRYAQVIPEAMRFEFARATLALDAAHRKALVAHEVGHVLEYRRKGAHSEDDADRAAREKVGVPICYDKRWPGKGLQVDCRKRNPSASLPLPAWKHDDEGVLWLECPFPRGKLPWVASHAAHETAEPELVRLADLLGTQRGVTERGTLRYLEETAVVCDGSDCPIVYRSAVGGLYIEDGHHRLTAALLRGDTTAMVKIVDTQETGAAMANPKRKTNPRRGAYRETPVAIIKRDIGRANALLSRGDDDRLAAGQTRWEALRAATGFLADARSRLDEFGGSAALKRDLEEAEAELRHQAAVWDDEDHARHAVELDLAEYMREGFDENPSKGPPFTPAEVEDVRADVADCVAKVADRRKLSAKYDETAASEDVIPVRMKLTRRGVQQADLFGNPQRNAMPGVGDEVKIVTHPKWWRKGDRLVYRVRSVKPKAMKPYTLDNGQVVGLGDIVLVSEQRQNPFYMQPDTLYHQRGLGEQLYFWPTKKTKKNNWTGIMVRTEGRTAKATQTSIDPYGAHLWQAIDPVLLPPRAVKAFADRGVTIPGTLEDAPVASAEQPQRGQTRLFNGRRRNLQPRELKYDGPVARARHAALHSGKLVPSDSVADAGTGAYMALVGSEIFHVDTDGFVYVIAYDNNAEAKDDYDHLVTKFPKLMNPRRPNPLTWHKLERYDADDPPGYESSAVDTPARGTGVFRLWPADHFVREKRKPVKFGKQLGYEPSYFEIEEWVSPGKHKWGPQSQKLGPPMVLADAKRACELWLEGKPYLTDNGRIVEVLETGPLHSSKQRQYNPKRAKNPKRSKSVTHSSVKRCIANWTKQSLPGGTRRRPDDFDLDDLVIGTKVEREHTSETCLAMEIAMDHLDEDPRYYEKLATIHKENPEPVERAKNPRTARLASRIGSF